MLSDPELMPRHPLPCPLASVRLSSAGSVGPLIRAVEAVTESAV
jgi:hypothetical protein